MSASHDELPEGDNYLCPICRRWFHCAYCHREEQLKEREHLIDFQPLNSLRFDKCPGCGEEAWLWCWEGVEPWCEDCIDEAHGRGHDAEEQMRSDFSAKNILDKRAAEQGNFLRVWASGLLKYP